MGTVMNCFVEVKKNGAWVPAGDISFADKIYDNKWILEFGGDIRDLVYHIHKTGKYDGAPNDYKTSLLLDELCFAYTKTEPSKWAKKLCNWLCHAKFPNFLQKLKNSAINKLVPMAEGSDPWMGAYGFGAVTLENMYEECDDARAKITKEIEYYAQHNDLINAFYEASGKKRDDEESMLSTEVLEYEDLSAANQIVGILQALSQQEDGYYTEDEVRLVYWFNW